MVSCGCLLFCVIHFLFSSLLVFRFRPALGQFKWIRIHSIEKDLVSMKSSVYFSFHSVCLCACVCHLYTRTRHNIFFLSFLIQFIRQLWMHVCCCLLGWIIIRRITAGVEHKLINILSVFVLSFSIRSPCSRWVFVSLFFPFRFAFDVKRMKVSVWLCMNWTLNKDTERRKIMLKCYRTIPI